MSTAAHGNPRIARHDEVKELLARLAEAEGWQTSVEPRNMSAVNRARPDVIFVKPGSRLCTDVTIVYEAKSRTRHKSLEDAAQAKNEMWRSCMASRGLEFVPFVVGQCGVFHDTAFSLLSRLFSGTARKDAREAVGAAVAEGGAALFAAALR